jgi:LuxR family transcriptional regulator, maltose regulon positive regulatory protein
VTLSTRATAAPALRRGTVDRTNLVDRLRSTTASVVAIVAPPGYGKTTLLAQWAQREGAGVAWISCDDLDRDPITLWTTLLDALRHLAPEDWSAPEVLMQTGGDLGAVLRLVAALSEINGRVVLMLDHVESVRGRESWAVLSELALRLPAGWLLALASREALPIPLSRLRMRGELLELGVEELALTAVEARALVTHTGIELDDDEAAELVRRTEGWPAGVYLGSLALHAGKPVAGFTFTGDDKLVRDYLRAELLPRVSDSEREFLMRTSLLDRMSGDLCDAVLGVAGSARTLEALEARNMLIVPLDRRGEWYRYHHLLRDLMRSELRHSDPGAVVDLHRRASAWFETRAQFDSAIAHARASGDTDRVARLVLEAMQPAWAGGRIETVRGWLTWLSRHPPGELYAPIMAQGSLIFALLGRVGDAERWIAAAESRSATGLLPDGNTQEATMAYLRANLARDGTSGLRRDVALALEGLGPVSPYRATMAHTVGLADLLDGDLVAAERHFEEAHELASAGDALPLVALVEAERHLVARDLGDHQTADRHLADALETVSRGRLDNFWTSALVFATAARAAAHRGRLQDARLHMRKAARLRPLLTHVLPVVSVQALVELTHGYLEMVDPAGAQATLDQASRILVRRPHLGGLAGAAVDLQERLGQITKAEAAGLSSLTAAELRLLPLLPTHLSFPQIAEQLHVSRHTVKTQVTAVYRKLGVSSRREAVARIDALRFA